MDNPPIIPLVDNRITTIRTYVRADPACQPGDLFGSFNVWDGDGSIFESLSQLFADNAPQARAHLPPWERTDENDTVNFTFIPTGGDGEDRDLDVYVCVSRWICPPGVNYCYTGETDCEHELVEFHHLRSPDIGAIPIDYQFPGADEDQKGLPDERHKLRTPAADMAYALWPFPSTLVQVSADGDPPNWTLGHTYQVETRLDPVLSEYGGPGLLRVLDGLGAELYSSSFKSWRRVVPGPGKGFLRRALVGAFAGALLLCALPSKSAAEGGPWSSIPGSSRIGADLGEHTELAALEFHIFFPAAANGSSFTHTDPSLRPTPASPEPEPPDHVYGGCTTTETYYRVDPSGAETPRYVKVIGYNGDSRRERATYDDGADGSIDIVTQYFYDDRGHLITDVVDLDNDGSVDYTSVWEHDTAGRVTSYVRFDGDNLPDMIYDIHYDPDGYLVAEYYDDDGDGQNDSVKQNTYDRNGYRIREVWDFDADGVWDVAYHHAWRSGLLEVTSVDRDLDGIVDKKNQFRYDHLRRLQTFLRDDDNNGRVDVEWTYRYGEQGFLTRHERRRGGLDHVDSYHYDPFGRLIEMRIEDQFFVEVARYRNECPSPPLSLSANNHAWLSEPGLPRQPLYATASVSPQAPLISVPLPGVCVVNCPVHKPNDAASSGLKPVHRSPQILPARPRVDRCGLQPLVTQECGHRHKVNAGPTSPRPKLWRSTWGVTFSRPARSAYFFTTSAMASGESPTPR